MADDLGDEWWLNDEIDDENDVLSAQNVKKTEQSKFYICVYLNRNYSG
jgi:hypothetical protein